MTDPFYLPEQNQGRNRRSFRRRSPGLLLALSLMLLWQSGSLPLAMAEEAQGPPDVAAFDLQGSISVQAVLSPRITLGRSSIEAPPIDLRTLPRDIRQPFQIPPTAATGLAPDSPNGLIAQGLDQLTQGQTEEAGRLFRQAVDASRRPASLVRTGEILAAIEQYAPASEAFRRAALPENEPNHPGAARKQAGPSYARLAESWRKHRLPGNLLPDGLNNPFQRAMGLSLQLERGGSEGSRVEAMALLKDVIRQAPGFSPAYRRLGEITSGVESIRWLRQAVAAGPADFRNHQSLADALMKQHRFAEAATAYQGACRVLQASTSAQSQPRVRYEHPLDPWFAPWHSQVEAGRKLALGYARTTRNARDAAGWRLIGEGFAMQYRLSEAEQALDRALLLQPADQDAHLQRFRIALQRSDWPYLQAGQARIAGLSTQNAMAAALLGEYQMRTRHYPQAARTLQRAIALNPRLSEPYLLLARVRLRQAELTSPRGEADPSSLQVAREILQRGLFAVPSGAARRDLTLTLANLWLEEGKTAQAEKLAQGQLALDPTDAEALTLLGSARGLSGDLAGARNLLEDALTFNPDHANAWLQLGHIALAEGRPTEAAEAYRKASQTDPLNEAAVRAHHQYVGGDRLRIGTADPKADKGDRHFRFGYLSEDEYDYLLILLNHSRQMATGMQTGLRALSDMPIRDGKLAFTVAGAQAVEALRKTSAQLSAEAQARSAQLRAIRPPRRFTLLHHQLEAACQNAVLFFRESPDRFPLLEAASPEDQASNLLLMKEFSASGAAIASTLDTLASRLPAPLFQGLLSEARADDLPALSVEIARLNETLAVNYLSPGKQEETSHPDPASPMRPGEVPVSLQRRSPP